MILGARMRGAISGEPEHQAARGVLRRQTSSVVAGRAALRGARGRAALAADVMPRVQGQAPRMRRPRPSRAGR